MEITGYWSYVILEALAIAGILVIYLYQKNRRLSAQLAKMEDLEGNQALEIDDDSAHTSEEILNTEEEQVHLAEESEAEVRQEDQSALIDTLQTRIQSYEMRISNLEQFKQLFFDLKMQQINNKSLNDKIRVEVDKAIPEQEQAPELKATLASLRDENRTLENQLTHIEKELDDVLLAAGPAGKQQHTAPGEVAYSSESTARSGIDCDVESIRRVISEYKKHVNELNGLVMNLKLDVKDKELLESSCKQLNAQCEDMQGAMSHLEEENEFLQEQISALLKQELEKDEQAKEDAVAEKVRVEERLKVLSELEGKYAEMEQLYLATYQENQRLSGSAGSG